MSHTMCTDRSTNELSRSVDLCKQLHSTRMSRCDHQHRDQSFLNTCRKSSTKPLIFKQLYPWGTSTTEPGRLQALCGNRGRVRSACMNFGSTPPHMSLAFQALLYLRGTVTCGVLQSPLRQSPRAGTTRWGRGTGVLLQHHALAPACNGSCHVHVSALVPSGW